MLRVRGRSCVSCASPGRLDFELFVFVARLEDRQIVTNELNRGLLARLISEKIIDPAAAPEYKVRNLDKLADALSGDRRTDHAAAPTPR